jgi:hypothetical protein
MFPATFSALILLSIFTGCTITREATLRDAQVKGMINLPPVHLAEDVEGRNIKITPHINYISSKDFKTSVTPDAYSDKKISSSDKNLTLAKTQQAEINSSGGNLTWEMPEMTGGLDLELFLTKGFGFTGSYNFAQGGGNGSFGLALQSAQKGFGVRFDAGLLFNHFSYDAYTIVEERIESIFGSESATYYFHDAGITNSTNFYISLTFNSTDKNSLLGFLLSLGYFHQTIFDYTPGNLDDGHYILFPPLPVVIINNTHLECTTGYFNLLPGIIANLNENIAIIGGVRMNTEISIGSGDVNFWPFIQTEFSF